MTRRYEKCTSEVTDILAEVFSRHHPDLVEGEVSVGCVFLRVFDKEAAVSGLKRHGVWAAAIIKIVSLEDRVRGMADANITIDGYAWDRLSPEGRKALLDHELTHLLVDEKGTIDAAGRPLLAMKPHDWEIWGFESIARRYGIEAPEVRAALAVRESYGQLLLWPEQSPAPKRVTIKRDVQEAHPQ